MLQYSAAIGASLAGVLVPPPAPHSGLRSVYSSVADARRIGREYLEMAPEEADPYTLVASIFGSRILTDARDVRAHLSNARDADFVAGRVAVVKGWVMALTEARWCALALFVDDVP